MTPQRIYVHIPYCAHKCHYCDFNSHVRKEIDWDGWLAAVCTELHYRATEQRPVASIFIGGGTPSLAPAATITALLQSIHDTLPVLDDAEITMEANPGTADAGRFHGYRAAGVNRLSIGVQSLHNEELRWLERIHDADQAKQAFTLARSVGFDNINLDLMYALPSQSWQQWQTSLQQAIALEPDHLSCYQLTVEANTRLAAMHANNPDMDWPEESLACRFFQGTRDLLGAAGYAAYEISNYARVDRHCRHNDGYWCYDDYIGIGPGAAGKRNTSDGGAYRYSNIRSPEKYIEQAIQSGHAIADDEQLTAPEAAREAFWLGLRRQQGVEHMPYRTRFGDNLLHQQRHACRKWQDNANIIDDDQHTAIHGQGWLLADEIAACVFE